ncbi:MAG: lantibiotic ABC transporter permease, partial [Streptococcus sp.]
SGAVIKAILTVVTVTLLFMGGGLMVFKKKNL